MTKREKVEWELANTVLYRQLAKDSGVVAKILEKAKARIVEKPDGCGFTILYREWKGEKKNYGKTDCGTRK